MAHGKKVERMDRRGFLKSSLGAAAAGPAGMAAISRTSRPVLGANERVNLALIGCGGRGSYNVRGLAEAGATVTHLCDLNEDRLDKVAAFLSEVQSRKPKLVKEMQRVFDSRDVDAVAIATPDHWHGPAAIMACQAGKDVYVEKPHAHNIWESRKMIEAARKYNRIIQAGTQNRSGAYNIVARDYVRSGKLGGVHLVKVYNLKPGDPFYLGDPGEQPGDMDWDAWLGPAPERPWHQNIYRKGWHSFWEYSGGDMANDGIHQIDLALMLMGDPGMSKRVSCIGGRFAYRGDDAAVPDTQVATFEFDDFVMTFELTGYPKYMRKTTGTIRRNDVLPYWTQNATRIELYGTELMMTVGRHGGGWQVTTSGGKVTDEMYGRPCDDEHYANFIDCVKSRKRPTADIEIAHSAATLVHMGNIAHRVGNVALQFDAEQERFVGNSDANKLVKRTYRKKYEVPERV